MYSTRALVKSLTRLLTRQDLAMMCQVSTRTINQWMRDRRVPQAIYIVPRAPRWCPEEIERWLLERKRASSVNLASKEGLTAG